MMWIQSIIVCSSFASVHAGTCGHDVCPFLVPFDFNKAIFCCFEFAVLIGGIFL